MDIAAVDGVSCTDTAVDAPCANLARTLAYLPAPAHPTELIYCFDVDGPGRPSPCPTTAITSTSASTAEQSRIASRNVGPNPAEGDPMPTYVMLTNLTADGVRTLKNNPGTGGGGEQPRSSRSAPRCRPVRDPRPVRLRHDRRGSRRADDGQGLGRARLARDDDQPDAERDAGRRTSRTRSDRGGQGRAAEVKVLVDRRRRARARDRAGAGALGPRAGAALRAGQRRDRRRRRVPARGRRRGRRGDRRRRPRAPRRPRRRSGPRRRWSPAPSTRLARPGSRPSGPSAAAAELEGSKAFAKELMEEAGVPTASHVLLRSREQAAEAARAAPPTRRC